MKTFAIHSLSCLPKPRFAEKIALLMSKSNSSDSSVESWPYGKFADDWVSNFENFGIYSKTTTPVRNNLPLIQFAILVRNAAVFLPLFLDCVANLDFPKRQICLDVFTNDNSDNTSSLIRDWLSAHGNEYHSVDFEDTTNPLVSSEDKLTWSDNHFMAIKEIRNASLERAMRQNVDFLFVCDVDVFLLPSTLSALIELNMPIVGPLIRFEDPYNINSNFAPMLDASGQPFFETSNYGPILSQSIRGVIDVPVIHCCYLIRKDVLPRVTYTNLHSKTRHEYLTFAENARHSKIPMFLDNRQLYGVSTMRNPDDLAVPGFLTLTRSKLERSWQAIR